MTSLLRRHMRRLYWMHGGAMLVVAAAACLAWLAPPIGPPPLAQAEAVLGVLVTLAALNLLTVLPARRAMVAPARRVFAVSAEVAPLLKAHLAAQATALVRGVALTAAGLAAMFLARRQDWFWILESSALLALIVLWPRQRSVASLLGLAP